MVNDGSALHGIIINQDFEFNLTVMHKFAFSIRLANVHQDCSLDHKVNYNDIEKIFLTGPKYFVREFALYCIVMASEI